MPTNFQARIIELRLVVILEEEYKGIEGWKCNELIVRIVLLLATSLVVDLVAFCLIKYISPEIS